MAANTQALSSVLNVGFTVVQSNTISTSPVIHVEASDSINEKADRDYEYARRNLYDVIEQGTDVLAEMINFAKQAQSPRAFEVVSTTINTLITANEKLLNLSKQVKDISGPVDTGVKNVTNNLTMVGTTKELLALIKRSSPEDDD